MKQMDGDETSINKENNSNRDSLPPRSEIHKEKKKKTKFKIQYPVIRLLTLLFVLLPIAILSYMFKSDKDIVEPSNNESSTFESIVYDKEDSDIKIEKETDKQEESDFKEEEPKTEWEENKQKNVEDAPKTTSGNESQEKTQESTVEQSVESEPVEKKEEPKDQYEIKYHKVKANETLFSVSIKYYKSRSGEELIKRWNDIDGETIIEGQVLRIPIKIN